jgi:hypothetical protein
MLIDILMWLLMWFGLTMFWQHLSTAVMRSTQPIRIAAVFVAVWLLFLFLLKPDLMEWLRSNTFQ